MTSAMVVPLKMVSHGHGAKSVSDGRNAGQRECVNSARWLGQSYSRRPKDVMRSLVLLGSEAGLVRMNAHDDDHTAGHTRGSGDAGGPDGRAKVADTTAAAAVAHRTRVTVMLRGLGGGEARSVMLRSVQLEVCASLPTPPKQQQCSQTRLRAR